MAFNVKFPKLGLEFKINRVAFSLFGLDIYWYGIIITAGMILCLLTALKLGKKHDINEDKFIDVIMLGTFMGIVCARAYYVIFSPVKYKSFLEMINLRDGGLAIYGGIIGGIIFGVIGCKAKKLDTLTVLDVCSICFLLGQGIGRWGNFFNQEAFGTNTNSVFGMISEGTIHYLTYISPYLASKGISVDPNMPVHPTFLYESVWCIVGFIILLNYFERRKFKGEVLCLYVIWYGVGRFFIEGLRTDSLESFAGFRISQVVALLSALISAIILFVNYRAKGKQNGKHK
jgi:phosphatidylglycerol:prolipoprotein diacylglycerol transferase